MSVTPEPQTDKSSFLPAYGTASLLCAVFAIVFSKVGSIVIDAVRQSAEVPADTASMVRGISIAAMILFGIMLLLAVGFGVLSLAGYGKRRKTSRPIFGVIGIVLAAFMAWVMWGSIQYVRVAAHRAGTETESIVKDEYGIELKRPAEDWLLFTDEETKRSNPLALTGAMIQTRNIDEIIMGLVFVEEVQEQEFSGFTPDDWSKILIQTSGVLDPAIEVVQSTTFQGRDATMIQYTGIAPSGVQIRTRQIIIQDGPRVIRIYCAGSSEHTDAGGAAFQPFFDAVTVR